ncbi:hypothetical protein D1614_05525 [Maribellus luteus]|uniref:Uncharacterized protein n=1 Tax=Maribellus luteus TaxID=2305463 RepID=A0A399T5H4_9BACT|nr:histidine kinase [Maribellus luteus]RIJ50204.1 hypothetical protein D1614_05525 [Maribellus luteus]
MKRLTFLLLCVMFFSLDSAIGKDYTEKELKQIVDEYFIIKDIPTRYYSNILIRMDGEVTQGDLAFMNQLTDNLKSHIDKWDVCLISEGTSNLILSINQPRSESYPQERLGNKNKVEIISRREPINIPEGTLQPERNKILYFTLMNSLVKYYKHKEVHELIPETVFALDKPEGVIINNPVDFQIIDEIYSLEYDNRQMNSVPQASTVIRNLDNKYSRVLGLLANIVSAFVAVLLVFFLFKKEVFKPHNYQFVRYVKQGSFVLLVVLIHLSVNFVLAYFLPISSSFQRILSMNAVVGVLSVLIVVPITYFSIIILYFSEKRILENGKSFIGAIVFPFITTLFVPSFLVLILFMIFADSGKPKNAVDVFTFLLSMISVMIIVAFFRAFFIFLTKKSESIINQKDVELARMSEMHRKAELQSLRAKINPHFLYNSLNSIASLASIDPKKTEQMALSLSDFFKYSINREQKQTNPLSDELKAVETYLDIEKVRFGERLTYSLECPEELKSVEIPQLLIQPLVENAVKHGVSKLLENGEVRIVVSELEFKKISIRVYDNGPGFPDGPMSGFGIRNTHERLQLIYGSKASINWQNDPPKYIEIVLPKHSA